MKTESEFDKNTLGWHILVQLNNMGEYLRAVFNSQSSLQNKQFDMQAYGYAALMDELENVMKPVLEGDKDYLEEISNLHFEDETAIPNSPAACFKYIKGCNEKLGVMSKRFYRFGLIPQLPTTMNFITRNQKYEKFRERIKAQAIKMIDLFGSELVEEVRSIREKKELAAKNAGQAVKELSEIEYSEIYREFLNKKDLKFEDIDIDPNILLKQ